MDVFALIHYVCTRKFIAWVEIERVWLLCLVLRIFDHVVNIGINHVLALIFQFHAEKVEMADKGDLQSRLKEEGLRAWRMEEG